VYKVEHSQNMTIDKSGQNYTLSIFENKKL